MSYVRAIFLSSYGRIIVQPVFNARRIVLKASYFVPLQPSYMMMMIIMIMIMIMMVVMVTMMMMMIIIIFDE